MAGDPRLFGSHWPEDPEPFLRLVYCFQCKTMEEIPDYHGNSDGDVVLADILIKHGGNSETPHVGGMLHIACSQWADSTIKRATVEGLWKGTTGFKPSYYDIKNTLVEDAGKCFNAHHRAVPCLDWHDSSKRLASPAKKDRETLALELHDDSIKQTDIKVFLCDFCPVAQHVATKMYDAAERKGLV